MCVKRSIAAFAAAAALAVAPFTVLQPSAEASTATTATTSTASVTALAARYTVTVKCQLVRINPYSVVGYVYGTGSGSNYQTALNNAKRDADNDVPVGHYKRHCYATN